MRKKRDINKDIIPSLTQLIENIARYNADSETVLLHPEYVTFTDGNGKTTKDHVCLYEDGIHDNNGIKERVVWFLLDRDYDCWSEIISKITNKYPFLSVKDIQDMIIGLINNLVINKWRLEGLSNEIEELLNKISNSLCHKEKYLIPIIGVKTEIKKLQVLDVTFKPIEEFPVILKAVQELGLFNNRGHVTDVASVAIAEAVGGKHGIEKKMKDSVNRAVNILRTYTRVAIRNSPYADIKMVEDYSSAIGLLFGYDNENGVYCRSMYSKYFPWLCLKINDQLERYLVDNGLNDINELDELKNKFDGCILQAIDWLGESTKPDRLEYKFLKVAVAIDALLGDEVDYIPDKGVTARISERASFLLADTYDDRINIYNKIHKYISLRGKVVHGSQIHITSLQIDEFAKYVRMAIFRLLQLKNKGIIKNSKGLAVFVQQQKFAGKS